MTQKLNFWPGMLGLFFVLAACSDNGVQPTPGEPAPAVVKQVEVAAGQTFIQVGQTAQLVAIPRDSLGRPLSREISWVSTQPASASVSSAGLVNAHTPGTTRILATSHGVVGFIDLTITAVPVVPVRVVQVSPGELLLNPGEAHPLTAVVKDSLGNVLLDRAITWTSFDTTVVTVSAAGVVTARREGVATVIVMVESVSAQLVIRVRPVPVARVALTVSDNHLELGEDIIPSTRAEAHDGTPLHGRTITLSSSDASVLQIGSEGEVRARKVGTATLRATSEGKFSELTITVHEPPAFAIMFDHMSASGNEIYFRKPDGWLSKLNAGNVSRHPSASPDGQRFVFAVVQINPATNQMMHDLYAVDRNGLNIRHLTQMAGIEDEPVWSPDGSKIAFSGAESSAASRDIYVMNADGTNIVNLTAGTPWENDVSPAWSPDSKTLAFTSMALVGGAHIYTINIDGTDRRLAASGAGGQARHPTWSPDGSKIAFGRSYQGEGMDIVIVSRHGGAETRIVRPGDQVDVTWSPDGKHFAFGEAQNGVWFLGTMRIDGTAARIRHPGMNAAWVTP